MKEFTTLEKAKDNVLPGQYLFARDKKGKDDKIVKEYKIFKHINQYVHMQGDKNYYEIINGWQRLYMDIDILVTEGISIDEVIAFISALEKHSCLFYGDTANIYSSNTKTKYSYHIIMETKYAPNNIECKEKIVEMLKTFDHPYKKYIDMKVYRKNQLLRLMGSSKMGKDNVKIFVRGNNSSFESSLVSNIEFLIL